MRIPLKHVALAALVLAGTGAVTVGVASSGGCQGGDAALAGRYRIAGLFGVGSTLSLKADGSFKYKLSYGALKQAAAGCWVQQGDKVALLADGETAVTNVQTLSNTDFRGLELRTRDDGALVWNIANSGRKAVYLKR